MRLWGELVIIVICVIVIAVVVSSYVFSSTPTHVVVEKKSRPKKLQPSEWIATDYTIGNETVVIVELRRPIAKGSTEYDALDKREVGRITNGLEDYDQLYYDAMQNANNRAAVLNALHH